MVLFFDAPSIVHFILTTPHILFADRCNPSNLNKLIIPADLPGSFIRSTVVKSGQGASLVDVS